MTKTLDPAGSPGDATDPALIRAVDAVANGLGGIDLAAVTTSMTISGPAVPVFVMYLVAAERQGADLSKLDGTLQTDIFKEYIAQKE